MSEMQKIGNHEISVKTYNGKRVVTFKDIDMVHERPEGTARKRFSDNRDRFIEEKDYFVVTPQMLENIEMSEKRTLENIVTSNRGTALITETGYLMLVKSFTDDLAWDVQRKLVDSYFRVKETVNTELSPELQMLQGLLNQMVQKELADKERDRQIAEARRIANKAVKTTENIKEAVRPIFDNWLGVRKLILNLIVSKKVQTSRSICFAVKCIPSWNAVPVAIFQLDSATSGRGWLSRGAQRLKSIM